ncbi:MAG: CGNR zinc finger domain-containing protein [Chloroflexota bacterium]|nr:MAG: CGNR zinc finger domain-containing protein [Chloroflexota bacterium]
MTNNDWDFDSGHLALDFANTAEFHASDHPDERLNTYADLVSWSEAAGILPHQAGTKLLAKSRREPQIAGKVFKEALEFREIIYRIFSALAGNEAPVKTDLSNFNRTLAASLKNSRVTNIDQGFNWDWQNMGETLDSMLWPIARESANLLISPEVKRVGECADDRGCGYLFIDTSRNHSRRWCSMEACGNRAKAQRHYQRKK